MTQTVPQKLKEAVKEYPDKIFLQDGDRALSFLDVDQASNHLAAALSNEGIGHGDKVAILACNQAEWLISSFAAAKIGASIIALNVRYREQEFQYMLNHSEVKALISISEFMGFSFTDFFASFAPKVPTVKKYIFIGKGFEGSLSYEAMLSAPYDKNEIEQLQKAVQPEDTFMMIYTSGTTGKPKAAMISHLGILASAQAQIDHFQVSDKDIAIGALPFNHVGGITCTIMVALLSKSKVILIPVFIPEKVVAAIEEHKATILGGVPTMYYMLAQQLNKGEKDFPSIRLCIAGGSNVEKKVVEGITAYFPNARIVNLYGLSETSGACVLSKLTDSPEKAVVSIGVPIGDYECIVAGPDNLPLSANEVGELLVKGTGVVKGYYKMPQETEESFTSDGWLRTGDMAAMDEEQYIYFKGRKKEMYIQGGFNIYPMEVENVLMQHPKVAMTAGIGVPDPFLGEVGVFYIVPKENESISDKELRVYCEERLADYKIPKVFEIVTQLPLTASGKVQKAQLKEMYLEKV